MAHDLFALGSHGFQDLGAALCIRAFGPSVQVMGAGRDGGRDLFNRGPLPWVAVPSKSDVAGEVWDGYTVMQVKAREKSGGTQSDPATWLWGQIREELNRWSDPDSDRTEVPDYLLFITNVDLTPYPGAGGHDSLVTAWDNYFNKLRVDSLDVTDGSERRARLARLSKIKKWRCWDGNQIQGLLTAWTDVRHAFPGFLTPGDILAALAGFSDWLLPDEVEPALREHARDGLIGENSVSFDEAGSPDGGVTPLHDVVIDLPVAVPGHPGPERAIRYLLDRGDHMLKPKLRAFAGPPHIVLAGAPGNGKTTLSKFVVQAYRASFLDGSTALGSEHEQIVAGTAVALERIGCSLPSNRRWPIRVDLARYAQDNGPSGDINLIRYMSDRITKRINTGSIRPNSLHTWLSRWPSLIMLDGLDEVTEPVTRRELISRIKEFAAAADADNFDTLVVVTTRPTGYVEDIAPEQFERLDLSDLDPQTAVEYGTLVAQVRLRGDTDRRERVTNGLRAAANSEAQRNLLRTPLQILILTIIIANAGQPAPDRYSLFWSYFETVLRRESSKTQLGLGRIVAEHAKQILQLHERVGFDLQIRSEVSQRATSTLTPLELRSLASGVLADDGYKPDGADAPLLDNLVKAATYRLVLIAPQGSEGYGFDVRSLQELMAARHLTNGPDEVTRDNLRLAAPSPHWRNTWIFAAGRIFARNQRHISDALVELVRTIDDGAPERLASIMPVGRELALNLIDDGMTHALPRWRDKLVSHSLLALTDPGHFDYRTVADALLRYADGGDTERQIIGQGLRVALAHNRRTHDIANVLQLSMTLTSLTLRPRTLELAQISVAQTPAPYVSEQQAWTSFLGEIDDADLPEASTQALTDAAHALAVFRSKTDDELEQGIGITSFDVQRALADPAAATALNIALANAMTVAELPRLSLLLPVIIGGINRTAIGDGLLSS